MERAAGVAPAPQVDEAFVVELAVNYVPVCLDLAVVVLEAVDRRHVAPGTRELVADAFSGGLYVYHQPRAFAPGVSGSETGTGYSSTRVQPLAATSRKMAALTGTRARLFISKNVTAIN
jgi:hypothetical protein